MKFIFVFVLMFFGSTVQAYWPYYYNPHAYTNNIAQNYMQWRIMNSYVRIRPQPPQRLSHPQYHYMYGYQYDLIPFGRYEQHLLNNHLQLQMLRERR